MKNKHKLLILSILFTTNNILYSVTNIKGDVIFWISLGAYKTKNVKKMTLVSVLGIIKSIVANIYKLGYKYLYIKTKGFNKNKKIIIRYLNQSSLNILLLSDKTSFPHNGCRKRKIRRL